MYHHAGSGKTCIPLSNCHSPLIWWRGILQDFTLKFPIGKVSVCVWVITFSLQIKNWFFSQLKLNHSLQSDVIKESNSHISHRDNRGVSLVKYSMWQSNIFYLSWWLLYADVHELDISHKHDVTDLCSLLTDSQEKMAPESHISDMKFSDITIELLQPWAKVLPLQLSGCLKGEPTQTRSNAFIDPIRNLSVSPGAQSSG